MTDFDVLDKDGTKLEKGDIVWGDGKKAVHPIVFLKPKNLEYFYGAMITKSSNYPNNFPMKPSHFEPVSASTGHTLGYNNSHVVKANLLKLTEWHPFTKTGKLTQEGIDFVESLVRDEPERSWD